jgi:hypothetical protein
MLWLSGDYEMCQVAGPGLVVPHIPRPYHGIGSHSDMSPPAGTPGPRLPASARDSPLPSGPALAGKRFPLSIPHGANSRAASAYPLICITGQQVRQDLDSAQHVQGKPSITGRGLISWLINRYDW